MCITKIKIFYFIFSGKETISFPLSRLLSSTLSSNPISDCNAQISSHLLYTIRFNLSKKPSPTTPGVKQHSITTINFTKTSLLTSRSLDRFNRIDLWAQISHPSTIQSEKQICSRTNNQC